LLGICAPLKEIEFKENVEPCCTGFVADAGPEETFGVPPTVAQETVLKADAEELRTAFIHRDSHKGAEIVFFLYTKGIDKFSDSSNVIFESTQEDGINDGCI
jgi:hypothetical protein